MSNYENQAVLDRGDHSQQLKDRSEGRSSHPGTGGGDQQPAPLNRGPESPLRIHNDVRAALLERHSDEHNAGHLYDRVAEHMQHRGYQGFAEHFRTAAAEERGPHAQRVEDILHAFDIDPPHPAVHEPDLGGRQSVLEFLYLAWCTEAELLRAYEQTKTLAADRGELAVESRIDAILEDQLQEVEEARNLYRRCESAAADGTGLMTIDGMLSAE